MKLGQLQRVKISAGCGEGGGLTKVRVRLRLSTLLFMRRHDVAAGGISSVGGICPPGWALLNGGKRGATGRTEPLSILVGHPADGSRPRSSVFPASHAHTDLSLRSLRGSAGVVR